MFFFSYVLFLRFKANGDMKFLIKGVHRVEILIVEFGWKIWRTFNNWVCVCACVIQADMSCCTDIHILWFKVVAPWTDYNYFYDIDCGTFTFIFLSVHLSYFSFFCVVFTLLLSTWTEKLFFLCHADFPRINCKDHVVSM